MQIGDGPAAVTGDDRCILSLTFGWEDAASRMSRESEDLPGWEEETTARTASYPVSISVDIKGYPGSFIRSGIFFVLPAAIVFLCFPTFCFACIVGSMPNHRDTFIITEVVVCTIHG